MFFRETKIKEKFDKIIFNLFAIFNKDSGPIKLGIFDIYRSTLTRSNCLGLSSFIFFNGFFKLKNYALPLKVFRCFLRDVRTVHFRHSGLIKNFKHEITYRRFYNVFSNKFLDLAFDMFQLIQMFRHLLTKALEKHTHSTKYGKVIIFTWQNDADY